MLGLHSLFSNRFGYLILCIFFVLKDVFPYDSERVVALCILSFIFLFYSFFNEEINNDMLSISLNIKKTLLSLANLKIRLLRRIRYS